MLIMVFVVKQLPLQDFVCLFVLFTGLVFLSEVTCFQPGQPPLVFLVSVAASKKKLSSFLFLFSFLFSEKVFTSQLV